MPIEADLEAFGPVRKDSRSVDSSRRIRKFAKVCGSSLQACLWSVRDGYASSRIEFARIRGRFTAVHGGSPPLICECVVGVGSLLTHTTSRTPTPVPNDLKSNAERGTERTESRKRKGSYPSPTTTT